jgi:hypothetical protein
LMGFGDWIICNPVRDVLTAAVAAFPVITLAQWCFGLSRLIILWSTPQILKP